MVALAIDNLIEEIQITQLRPQLAEVRRQVQRQNLPVRVSVRDRVVGVLISVEILGSLVISEDRTETMKIRDFRDELTSVWERLDAGVLDAVVLTSHGNPAIAFVAPRFLDSETENEQN